MYAYLSVRSYARCLYCISDYMSAFLGPIKCMRQNGTTIVPCRSCPALGEPSPNTHNIVVDMCSVRSLSRLPFNRKFQIRCVFSWLLLVCACVYLREYGPCKCVGHAKILQACLFRFSFSPPLCWCDLLSLFFAGRSRCANVGYSHICDIELLHAQYVRHCIYM